MVALDLVARVKAYCLRYRMFAPGERVLVGVSGGPDSVALLDVLYRLCGELGIELSVAHLNHLLRGREAASDAAYVAGLADRYGLPLVLEECNVRDAWRERGGSLQAVAREMRYRFYERAAEKTGAARVALGHQADDHAETILFNFLRGTGIAGLAGIPPVRERYVRPLLAERRRTIEDYCRERGLAPREDASNLKRVYTRNRLRLELIPYLEREYNPNLVPTLLRMAEVLREEEALLEAEAGRVLAGVVRAVDEDAAAALERRPLLELPPALQRRVVRGAWEALPGGAELPFEHVERVLDLARRPRGGGRVELPGGARAVREGDRLVLRRGGGERPVPFSYPLAVPGETAVPEAGKVIAATVAGAADGLPDPRLLAPRGTVLDLDRLAPPLTVRSRRPGDMFAPSGGGTVKLKKFLIDAKVPRSARDAVPLVVDGEGRIAWVAGLRTAEFCRLTPRTRRAVILEAREAVPRRP
ncbi:MAG: tRNA lysidine(34) synthetase TilS [Thermoanaerobacterales bacterium]|nr:tRNA lysidine(34) synthetase TilS [Thermoanaerobacterales bacterium]